MLSFHFISSFHFLSRVCLLLYVYYEWCMCSSKTYLIFFLRDSFFCYSSVKLAVVVEKKKSTKKTDCTDQELSRKNTFFLGTCVYKLLCRTDRQKHLQLVWWNTLKLNCTALFFFLVCVSLDYCFITFIVIIITATTRETTTIKTDTHFYTHIQASP